MPFRVIHLPDKRASRTVETDGAVGRHLSVMPTYRTSDEKARLSVPYGNVIVTANTSRENRNARALRSLKVVKCTLQGGAFTSETHLDQAKSDYQSDRLEKLCQEIAAPNQWAVMKKTFVAL
jgi:hypothetical protein